MKKKRITVPASVAAEILFAADRTCCVCRDKSNPIQIHHIDEDPSNNKLENLAVLCLPCHDDTQITGGFGRKLEAHQVRLYKEDWDSRVRHVRIIGPESSSMPSKSPGMDLRLATTLPEIFKATADIHSLVSFYDQIGNTELRDHYIEEILSSEPEPWVVTWVARLQNRSAEIPVETYEQALKNVGDDYMVESSLLNQAGRPVDAAIARVQGVLDALHDGEFFNAAFNLKRINDNPFVDALFKIALEETDDEDLWWKLRCFQELGWKSEARELLTTNEERIRTSDSLLLKRALSRAIDDTDFEYEIEKQIAQAGVSAYASVELVDEIGKGDQSRANNQEIVE